MKEVINKINEELLSIGKEKNVKISGMLITDESNIKYILKNEIEGYIYIENNNMYIITDSRYTELVSNICDNVNVFLINLSNDNYPNQLLDIFENKIVGIESKNITIFLANMFKERYHISQYIELIDVIENIRIIKNDEEMLNIKKACEITDKAFEYICKHITPGMSEKQIKDELEYYMKKQGAQDISFDSVIASGENSSKPHAVASERKVQKNDIILLDFGCKYNEYCSDMTRTIFVGGITDKQRNIYNIVSNAQLKAIKAIKEGINVKDIDDIVRNEFKKYNLEKNYLHSTGHGVGLDIHESPVISNRYDAVLKEGMIITVEPGIYFKKEFGIRIEDTVLVTKNGCEVLFNSSKDIKCIS